MPSLIPKGRRFKSGPAHLPRKGAEELKSQIKEQERIYSSSGLVTYQHPENRHDNQFWALCLALHAAKENLVKHNSRSVAEFISKTACCNFSSSSSSNTYYQPL